MVNDNIVVVTVGSVVIFCLLVNGLVQRRENRRLRSFVATIEKNLNTKVEDRLISHTKYCADLDTLIRSRLEQECTKWSELLEEAECQVEVAVEKATIEATKMVQRNKVELAASLQKMSVEVSKKMDDQKSGFKSLMDAAYLEQYEKMRRNPPRPKKGPRKKIDPPNRYRSLDDEFCSVPPQEDSQE